MQLIFYHRHATCQETIFGIRANFLYHQYPSFRSNFWSASSSSSTFSNKCSSTFLSIVAIVSTEFLYVGSTIWEWGGYGLSVSSMEYSYFVYVRIYRDGGMWRWPSATVRTGDTEYELFVVLGGGTKRRTSDAPFLICWIFRRDISYVLYVLA